MTQSFDFFNLFGLPARFALDPVELEVAFKQVQGKVHPDRFASASPAERRVAMQWATLANEGYQVLRAPARRAAYLCERNGAAIDAESNTAMPPAFLMQQMAWREALDDADADAALDVLATEVSAARAQVIADLGSAIDADRDFPRAAALVRRLMFIDKFDTEVERARHARQDAEQRTT